MEDIINLSCHCRNGNNYSKVAKSPIVFLGELQMSTAQVGNGKNISSALMEAIQENMYFTLQSCLLEVTNT